MRRWLRSPVNVDSSLIRRWSGSRVRLRVRTPSPSADCSSTECRVNQYRISRSTHGEAADSGQASRTKNSASSSADRIEDHNAGLTDNPRAASHGHPGTDPYVGGPHAQRVPANAGHHGRVHRHAVRRARRPDPRQRAPRPGGTARVRGDRRAARGGWTPVAQSSQDTRRSPRHPAPTVLGRRSRPTVALPSLPNGFLHRPGWVAVAHHLRRADVAAGLRRRCRHRPRTGDQRVPLPRSAAHTSHLDGRGRHRRAPQGAMSTHMSPSRCTVRCSKPCSNAGSTAATTGNDESRSAPRNGMVIDRHDR